MQDFSAAFLEAGRLLVSGDPVLAEIVGLSLMVTLSATAIAALIGLPLGALLAVARFPGRGAALAVLNALMGLPPVVVGLVVYMALSRAGPLGFFGLLYTPGAMVIAQSILITPIVAALSAQTLGDLGREYDEELRVLGLSTWATMGTLLVDARFALLTAVLAGFGRAIAEVGAVMIVGGNIAHHTRVMTTAIALETSKGELALALGLGAVLLMLSVGVTGLALTLRARAERRAAA